jgi:hypothetical protein
MPTFTGFIITFSVLSWYEDASVYFLGANSSIYATGILLSIQRKFLWVIYLSGLLPKLQFAINLSSFLSSSVSDMYSTAFNYRSLSFQNCLHDLYWEVDIYYKLTFHRFRDSLLQELSRHMKMPKTASRVRRSIIGSDKVYIHFKHVLLIFFSPFSDVASLASIPRQI